MTTDARQAGSVDLGHQTARTVAAWWRASDLGGVLLDGADAAAFLHNMLTADVKRLAINQAAIACQTTPRGETQAIVLVVRTGDSRYLLIDAASDAARLHGALEKLHFSESFASTLASDRLVLFRVVGPKAQLLLSVVGGPDAAKVLASVAEGSSLALKLGDADVRAVHSPTSWGGGWLLIAGVGQADSLEAALDSASRKIGGVRADGGLGEALRVESGVPKLGVDLPPNAIASELGIDHPSLNYDKGCYVGQEIIARIRTKGHAPIRVMGVLLSHAPQVPAAGEALLGDDGSDAGVITSATYSPAFGHPVALARIKKSHQVVGVKIRTASGVGGEVCLLPFVLPAIAPTSSMYDQALIMFAENRESEAVALLQRELNERPGNVDAWEAMGVIHDRAGRHRDAVEAMKKIVAIDPKHLMANVNLSMYHMKLGDKATAEEFQAKATSISLELRMAEARAKGGVGAADADLERIQKTEARLGKFKQIIEMDPGDVLGHFGAGKACLDLKRFGEAAKHFEETLRIQPDYSVAWANLGQAYAALGENDRARETFTRGIEVARAKGDMMPVRDMQTRLDKLNAVADVSA